MPSRTFSFNMCLFKKALRRWWLLGLVFFAVSAVLVLDNTASYLRMGDLMYARQSLLDFVSRNGALLSCFFSLGAVSAMFGWMYGSRSAACMTALPVTREEHFFSHAAAGASLLAGAQVLTALLYGVLSLSGGAGDWLGAAQYLAISLLQSLFFYGFALFCAMLTGNIFVLPAVYAVFLFTAVTVEAIVHYIAEFLIYGMPGGTWKFSVASPLYTQMSVYAVNSTWEPGADGIYCLTSVSFGGWKLLSVYAAVGLVFFLLALTLFRRRKMEAAGEIVAIDVLRPIFRWCLALAFSLGAAMLYLALCFDSSSGHGTWGRSLVLMVCMLLGLAAGWFGADIIMERTFHPRSRHGKGLALYACLMLAVLVGVRADVIGFESVLPEPGEAESVIIESPFGGIGTEHSTEFRDPENLARARELHTFLLQQKQTYTSRLPRYYDNTFTIRWTAGGRTFDRTYCIPEDPEVLRRLQDMQNSPEAIAERMALSVPVTAENLHDCYANSGEEYHRLTREEAAELYETCIQPDIADGTLGQTALVFDDAYYASFSNVLLYYELHGGEQPDDFVWDYFNLRVPFSAERTVRWLTDHGITPGPIPPEGVSEGVSEAAATMKYAE